MIAYTMDRSDSSTFIVAKWVALGALFLIPFTPLIVANTYFFPFITGKAFFFRILVEIVVVAWVILAFLDQEYRPRFSWIGVAVVAFVLWMFIADLFAVNVAKAFWSNFERMEGWVLLIHLLGLFFASSAVLRAEKKWRLWFLWSLVVSLWIVGYALLQLAGSLEIHQGSTRIDASFGNSAYLAIYLLFNVFIALWLALTEEQVWLKWCLFALAGLDGILIFYTETRGTIIGLVGGLTLAAVLALLTAGKRGRRAAAGGLLALLIVVGGFYVSRNSAFVQGNHVLQRIASISLADGQTRFTIWHMALEGVAERPVVGWGQEGFNYIFNKYYDPSLYNQESWFDRAHDAFIDWLTAGGIPAFLLYLSLFVTAIMLLWRSSELSRPERIVLTAALVGYACHNIFVFDNLYSYVYFFAVLALIDSQVARPLPLAEWSEMSDSDGLLYALPIGTVTLIGLIWFVNVTGIQTAQALIRAMSPSQGGVDDNVAQFEALSMHPSFAAQEIREQLVSLAITVAGSSDPTTEQKQKILSLAINEMKKQVDAYPEDARERLQLAYAYRAAGDLENALAQIRAAQQLSPNKEEMWIEAGIAEWNLNDMKAVQADFVKAYSLGPQFSALAAYAAAGDIVIGDTAAADKILQDAFGTTSVDHPALALAYYRTQNWSRLVQIWELRAQAPGAPVQTWFSLAAAYYAAGDRANAIATIHKAVELFPEAAASGDAAITQIQQGATIGQ